MLRIIRLLKYLDSKVMGWSQMSNECHNDTCISKHGFSRSEVLVVQGTEATSLAGAEFPMQSAELMAFRLFGPSGSL